MHGLADDVVAPKRERQVGNATRNVAAGQGRLDGAGRLNEVQGVLVMLLDARRDGQDVRVEDDVFGREADFFGEYLVGACADRDLALGRVRLPLLIKSHDDGGRTVAADELREMLELLLAFLEADGVDDALARQALQAGLDNGPLGAIHHDGHSVDVRLTLDESQEAGHGRLTVQHALVHVDVYDLRAVVHLLLRDRQGSLEVALQNELLELRRAGDVGALADVDEVHFGPPGEGLGPVQPRVRLDDGRAARRAVFQGLGVGADELRRGAAAAADDVQPAVVGPLADGGHHIVHGEAEARLGEWVGQAGVRVRAKVDRCDAG